MTSKGPFQLKAFYDSMNRILRQMQEGTVSVASVAIQQRKNFIPLSFLYDLPYCSIQKYSMNVLKNMNNFVCKTCM